MSRLGRVCLSVAFVLLAVACADDGLDKEVGLDAVPGQVDLTLTRDDIDCSDDVLGNTDETAIVAAHWVVNGALGATCWGDEDATLIRAFEELAVITPPLQLADLGLFAGFVWQGGDDATLAFVAPIDDDGSQFVMAIGLDSYDNDPTEASLTMAHEFAHVFTATPPELNRSVGPQDCATYWNGEGCFVEGSLMAQWVAEFWPADLLDQIDPEEADVATADGDERCALNDGFFGAYAATTPDEDFAESFSAFVYDLAANTAGQQAKLDWMFQQPGLSEFQDRATDVGLTPLDNTFQICGSG